MEGSSSQVPAGTDVSPKDSAAASLLDQLCRFGASELAWCSALALRASELCGGRHCRIELAVDGSTRVDPRYRWLPIPGPRTASGKAEAWLGVERREEEPAGTVSEELGGLVDLAGLLLERHRLMSEVARARRATEETRSTLGHAVRNRLNPAFLRAERLLMQMRNGGGDSAEVKKSLEVFVRSVQELVEQMHQLLEPSDGHEQSPVGRPSRREEPVRVPDLLRDTADAPGTDAGPLHVEVVGEVPPVRADRRRLKPILGELVDLALQSPGTPTLTVRPEVASSGVRVVLSVDLQPVSAAPSDRRGSAPRREAAAGRSEASAGSARPDRDVSAPPRPSLRQLLGELGGRLSIDAYAETHLVMIVRLPEEASGERADLSPGG